MYPCQTCGAVDIDANGYCVNCRTYRGALGYYEVMPQTPAPPSAPPTGPMNLPVNGPMVTTPPQGYFAPPISGAPAPISGAPPAPTRRQVPLSLMLLTTAMLVAVSVTLVFVLLRGGTGTPPQATPASGGSSSAAPSSVPPTSLAPVVKAGLDKCLIGTWVATTDYFPLTQDASVLGVSHSGPIFKIGDDGKLAIEFGSGVSYTGTVKGKKAEALLTGRVGYDYTTVNRVMSMTNPTPDVRIVYTLDDVVQSSQQTPFTAYSFAYACDGDKLTVSPDAERPGTMRRQ